MVASTKGEHPGRLQELSGLAHRRVYIYDDIKRILDIAISLMLLTVTSPLILVAMLIVWAESKGSPLYRQRRLGHGGKVITIYKIRTMHQGSERDTGPVWSGRGDPRVTPIGRILRASHLDELPQLINVLKGEMSLIGPRPERPEIVSQLEAIFPRYRDRLRILPGLTGLAQVIQAPDTGLYSVARKLHYDLFYLEQAGFLLDARIVMGTLLHVLHVPPYWIVRICLLPVEAPSFGDEMDGVGGRIAVSIMVHPTYVN